jgi:hypothetical protein
MSDIRRIDMPPDAPRVETGTVQFGEDWPGVFIRGDDAAYYAMALRCVLEMPPDDRIIEAAAVSELADTLEASRVRP